MPLKTEYTREEWIEEAHRRFGPEPKNIAFICPACRAVMTVENYQAAGAPEGAVGFSCVGRWSGAKREAFSTKKNDALPGPCNYAGGGLFAINPITVIDEEGKQHHVFAFADPTENPDA